MIDKNSRPLGKILHVVRKEAICHPMTGFKGKGWKVWIGEDEIGTLSDPFGNVDRPYQAILLHPKFRENNDKFIGIEAFAKIKSKRKRRKKRNNKKSQN